MRIASAGEAAGLLHVGRSQGRCADPVRLNRASRSDLDRIQNLKIDVPRLDSSCPSRELLQTEEVVDDKSIYHKNLMPVTYVTADMAGAIESACVRDS